MPVLTLFLTLENHNKTPADRKVVRYFYTFLARKVSFLCTSIPWVYTCPCMCMPGYMHPCHRARCTCYPCTPHRSAAKNVLTRLDRELEFNHATSCPWSINPVVKLVIKLVENTRSSTGNWSKMAKMANFSHFG